MIRVVNMIPPNWSDEQNQDAEPNISVNPANPSEIIATAFTYDNPAGSSAPSPAMATDWAPIFHSIDGGQTWKLRFVLPSGAGDSLPTFDVTSRFGGSSGEVYAGLISATSGSILIARAPDATTQLQNLVTRDGDQPFVEATTALGGSGSGEDRVYVGYNSSGNATVDESLDAATQPPPAGFGATGVDARNGTSGPKVRTAIHANGTIYIAFYSMNPSSAWDVVVVKDLSWGASVPPYGALIDSGDHLAGVRVATSISVGWSNAEQPDFGNDRRGWELAIAVDPNDDQRVYIVYSQGTTASDYTLHLRRSMDGGATWLPDSRTIVKAKNPAVAINSLGHVGFVYQQVVGPTGASNWVTVFEHSQDDFSTLDSHVLANVPASVPTPATAMATYIGDYIGLKAVGKGFYGIFSANNTPDLSNFPSGVAYQRNVDTVNGTLLGNDAVTTVPPSIDPFFFSSTSDSTVDFYVRDWTASPVSFDTGVEPSTNPVFYSASDVWNQRSNVGPTFNANNQPNHEDPQVSSMGSNYAFARISRRAAAAPGTHKLDVTAEFMFADFGLGAPYVDISGTPTTIVTFHHADMQLVTPGVAWLLPSTHSQHVCMAVQISSPDDPYQNPSLLGTSPGWPTGADVTVLNDNNKAQRNMAVYPAGQFAGLEGGDLRFYALIHNAASDIREMLIEYGGGSIHGKPATHVEAGLFGRDALTLHPGDILRVPGMMPGENRWLVIHIDPAGRPPDSVLQDFREIVAGRALSGFRVVAQPTSTMALIKNNVDVELALLGRMRSLFDEKPPAKMVQLLTELDAQEDKVDQRRYEKLISDSAWRSWLFQLLETEVDTSALEVDLRERRIAGIARRGDVDALAVAHAALLHDFDALTTMVEKARGDSADVLLNLAWQRSIYAQAKLPLPLVDEVRRRSSEFIRAFQQRRVYPEDFHSLLKDLVPAFEKTAAEFGQKGRHLKPLIKSLTHKARPNDVQRRHRAYLIGVYELVFGTVD